MTDFFDTIRRVESVLIILCYLRLWPCDFVQSATSAGWYK